MEMEKKTNSYVEAVKQATAKQQQDEQLGFDFGACNKWVWYMDFPSKSKISGKHLREI